MSKFRLHIEIKGIWKYYPSTVLVSFFQIKATCLRDARINNKQ